MRLTRRLRLIIWWTLRRWTHVWRAAGTGGSLLSTVALGVLSIVLALYAFYRGMSIPSAAPFTTWFAIVAISILLISVFLASWRSLHARPPVEYAEITLSGRNVSEILLVLAYEIRKVCIRFYRRANKFHELARRYVDILKTSPRLDVQSHDRRLVDLRRRIHAIQRLSLIQHADLQRLLAMKKRASTELAIPQRRLCDHLLQFSPLLQADFEREFPELWMDILKNLEADRDKDVENLLTRVTNALEKARSRVKILERLFDHSDLLEDIHALASRHSTSGSIIKYALTLARLAREAQRRLATFKGNLDDPDYDWVIDRFHFLYQKQRAYAGVHPHDACTRICVLLKRCDAESDGGSEVRNLQNLMTALAGSNWRVFLEQRGDGGMNDSARRKAVIDSLLALSRLGDTVQQFIGQSRGELAQVLVEKVAEPFFNHEQDRNVPRDVSPSVVVTHGFSHAVLECLGCMNAKLSGNPREVPRVFVLYFGEEGWFDAQKMVLELEYRHSSLVARALSDIEAFIGLLTPETKVLLLLGAEAFDRTGRVVHPRGLTSLDEFKVKMGSVNVACKIVVAAEGYKLFERGLDAAESFFQFHLDRLNVYQLKFANGDVIVSDSSAVRAVVMG